MLSLRSTIIAWSLSLVVVAVPAPAAADDAGELIELLEKKPADLEMQQWKERRREAARRLGDMGDKKAVPALIRVVKAEEFDIVGERAIEALGKLGDKRALPVLRDVAADPSRDRDQRDAARDALERLGTQDPVPQKATASPPPAAPKAPVTGLETATASTPVTPSDAEVPSGPRFSPDTLASGERIQLAIGELGFEYDSIRDRPAARGDFAGSYERIEERKQSSWRYGLDAGGTFGVIDYDGEDSSSKFANFGLLASGEGRVYLPTMPAYGGGIAGLGATMTIARVVIPDADDQDDFILGADVQLGIVAGYGRVLDIGEALRLRRIEMVLRETKTLGRPLTPDLAERVLATWWALRGELGVHDRLTVTVKMLREAGVLLEEPNASTTYKILQVLRDGQLTHRLSGLDVSVGIVESYIMRDEDLGVDDGRSETAIFRARYGKQLGAGDEQLVGSAFGRYRVLAPEDEASPWSLGGRASFQHFLYGPNYDAIGAIDLGAELGLSSDGIDGVDKGYRAAASGGYRWTFNRTSGLRLAAEAAYDSGALFLGVVLDGSYGFLDVGFVGASALPAAL